MVDESNTRMNPDLQLVCNYDTYHGKIIGREVICMKCHKKLRISSRTPADISHCDNDDVELPLPVNGREYRKPEVVNILASYKKGSKEIGLAMKNMIQLKYVPVCDRSLQRMIERANNGRIPVASLDEIKAIAEKMEDQSGRTISQDDVTKLLSDHHMKKIKDAGYV